MHDQASVRSFESIQRVREELLAFGHRSSDGLTEIESEIRRVIDWVEHDRPSYWKHRVRKSHDAMTEAKGAVHRCLMYPINDEQPSCTEERAALRKAEAALDHAREKQERVRYWSRLLRHEILEYQGGVAHLKEHIEIDVPKGTARLGRTLAALEQYTNMKLTGSSSASTAEPGNKQEAATSPKADTADKSDADDKQADETPEGSEP